eukprot:CAMPEP_0113585422 /NCGR_PEP_ID=MMETSP0015_2-20120614/33688_1 /TAXON_ID=2838 /ORGANISM="Odontella" /LENGTH=249 /DNA_ID=CAMNT_0000490657 /DNA_START=133 /DNA_END=882 /DNA_ORIENTATION=+ /assembly_acc=CAM_ASM_000160
MKFLPTMALSFVCCSALQQQQQQQPGDGGRRSFLARAPPAAAAVVSTIASSSSSSSPSSAAHAHAADLTFATSSTGLQWADAKVGSGAPPSVGNPVSIDYVMSTTGARYGAKIYSTIDANAPYRWIAGDGTTVKGVEMAVLGVGAGADKDKGDGAIIPPMLPGGVRRVIIPSKLGYESLARPISGMQYQDCQEGKGVGPIPPAEEGTAGEYYQRFKNIYCNANRPYQPDLVMDIKLYGKRTAATVQSAQ